MCVVAWPVVYGERVPMWDARGVEVDIFVECNVPYMGPNRIAKAYAVAGKVIEGSEYGEGRSAHPDAASSAGAPPESDGGAEGPAVADSVGVEGQQSGSAGGDGACEGVEGANGGAEGAALADPVGGAMDGPYSTQHLMTHYPKRGDCPACQAAKMKDALAGGVLCASVIALSILEI